MGDLTMTKKRYLLATLIAASCCVAPRLSADEIPSPYYEDDAWYDVSEWFDGNDYNPTDEAIGRWDDEVFHFSDNATSTDQDNDTLGDSSWWGDYGYADNTRDDDRWFYDYYDDGSSQWNNDERGMNTYTFYNDANNDGLYDSYWYYSDTDNDGVFEDYVYYSFDRSSDGDQKSQRQGANQQKQVSSKSQQLSGTVDKTKMVNVRDRKHLVAHVKGDDGSTTIVDLGPQQKSTKLAAGDQLTASGHRVQVGDKQVLVATEAQSKSADFKIDRNGRKFSGQVASLREVKVQGQTHLLAKLKTENDKMMLVDLGAKQDLSNAPQEGDSLKVQGVPVKVNDRIVLMARTLELDGNKIEIGRKRQVAQK
jgi:hypothetical protein